MIFPIKYTDPKTGVEIVSDSNFTVWADKKMGKVIENIEGVMEVFQYHNVEFYVYIDKRYDMEFIKREIESAIKCAETQLYRVTFRDRPANSPLQLENIEATDPADARAVFEVCNKVVVSVEQPCPK